MYHSVDSVPTGWARVRFAKVTETRYGYDEDARANREWTLQWKPSGGLSVQTYDGLSYDARGQLETANGISYPSDANGNPVGSKLLPGNRLETINGTTYRYDGEGNRIRTTTEQAPVSAVTTYQYDQANRLTGYDARTTVYGSGIRLTVAYSYDVFGNRLREVRQSSILEGAGQEKVSPPQTTYRAYDGLDVRSERTGNQLARHYLRGDGVDQVFGHEVLAEASWYLTDRLGSVRAVVSEDSVVVERRAYDAFGVPTPQPHATLESDTQSPLYATPYGYTSREYDAGTGLQYNRARYYDPKLRRFISEDPLGLAAGDTNLYRYVGNNPANRTDPSGLAFQGVGGELLMFGSYVVQNPGDAGYEGLVGANQGGAVFWNAAAGGRWEFAAREARIAEQDLGPTTTTIVGVAGVVTRESLIMAATLGSGSVLRGVAAGGQYSCWVVAGAKVVTSANAVRDVYQVGAGGYHAYQAYEAGDVGGILWGVSEIALGGLGFASNVSALAKAYRATSGSKGFARWLFEKSCFGAGTLLVTREGCKAIEEFREGDRLLSRSEWDPDGPVEEKVVEEVFVRTARVWHLHVGNRVIKTTAEHPFWVRLKGWVSASMIQPGDELSSHDGQWVAVEEVYDTGEHETVYNLRVTDFHTYFVGGAEWGFSAWAHNACDEAHNAANYMKYKKQLEAAEIAKPGNSLRGRVVFNNPLGGTTAEGQNMIREAAAYGNLAEQNGFLSPTGRVSTVGALRADASAAADVVREAAAEAGTPYRFAVGHGPDTTWTGTPQSPYWQDTMQAINSSIGSQARRYPIGFRPTGFVYAGDL